MKKIILIIATVIATLPVYSHSLESLSVNMMNKKSIDELYQQNLSLINEEVDDSELTFQISDSTIEEKKLSGNIKVIYSDTNNSVSLNSLIDYNSSEKSYIINPSLSYTYKINSSNQKAIENLDKEFQSFNLSMNHDNSKYYIQSQILNTIYSIESDERELFVLQNDLNTYLKSVEREKELGRIVDGNLNHIEATYKLKDYQIAKSNLESKINRSKENFKFLCDLNYSKDLVDELIQTFDNPEIVSSDELSMNVKSNIKKYNLSQENLINSIKEEKGLSQSITGTINSNINNDSYNYGAGISYRLNSNQFALDVNTAITADSKNISPSLSIGAHYTFNKNSKKKIRQNELEVMNSKITLEESKRSIQKAIEKYNSSVVEYNSNLELLKNKLNRDKAILLNKTKLFEKGLISKDEIEVCENNIRLDEKDIRLTQINRESINLNIKMTLISGDN